MRLRWGGRFAAHPPPLASLPVCKISLNRRLTSGRRIALGSLVRGVLVNHRTLPCLTAVLQLSVGGTFTLAAQGTTADWVGCYAVTSPRVFHRNGWALPDSFQLASPVLYDVTFLPGGGPTRTIFNSSEDATTGHLIRTNDTSHVVRFSNLGWAPVGPYFVVATVRADGRVGVGLRLGRQDDSTLSGVAVLTTDYFNEGADSLPVTARSVSCSTGAAHWTSGATHSQSCDAILSVGEPPTAYRADPDSDAWRRVRPGDVKMASRILDGWTSDFILITPSGAIPQQDSVVAAIQDSLGQDAGVVLVAVMRGSGPFWLKNIAATVYARLGFPPAPLEAVLLVSNPRDSANLAASSAAFRGLSRLESRRRVVSAARATFVYRMATAVVEGSAVGVARELDNDILQLKAERLGGSGAAADLLDCDDVLSALMWLKSHRYDIGR